MSYVLEDFFSFFLSFLNTQSKQRAKIHPLKTVELSEYQKNYD